MLIIILSLEKLFKDLETPLEISNSELLFDTMQDGHKITYHVHIIIDRREELFIFYAVRANKKFHAAILKQVRAGIRNI